MFGRSRPEALERIVYCSRARIDTTSLQAIAEILGVSQRNNAREGLTGALAVNDGWFLQVVEGPGACSPTGRWSRPASPPASALSCNA